MKCFIPEISWHNRDPILSIDVQPNSKDGIRRLATGGTDAHVLLWSITVSEDGMVNVEVLSDLQRHQRSVNAVRFSPDGEMLASGDDEAVIILWVPKGKSDAPDIFSKDSESENKENWNVLKILRGHTEDVYDLCWSPNSLHLISGSVDNTAFLWDVHKGRSLGMLSEHKGFVQGVAWDPKNQHVATLSSDRTCRVYSLKTNKIIHKINQATLKLNDEEEKTYKLFHDDTLKTFCRRLCFTPDGSLLLAPCGYLEPQQTSDDKENTEKKKMNAVYAFTRGNLSKPAAIYPTLDKYSIAVRCCPVLFQLRPNVPTLYNLPYRMVFAVATQNAVLLYDTQQIAPFARIARIHYTRLTDLTWSSDARLLVVSSTDGYCSLISFAENELGVPYVEAKKSHTTSLAEGLPQNFESLLQGEIQKNNLDLSSDAMEEDFQLIYEETNATVPAKQQNANPESETKVPQLSSPAPKSRSPRRVQFITLSSPKQRKH